MNHKYYLKILRINKLLIRRDGSGASILVIIFFGVVLMSLYFALFNLLSKTDVEMTKQLLFFTIFIYLMSEVMNIFFIINRNTLLSRNFLLVFPISKKKYLGLIFIYFLRNIRVTLTILPLIVLCFLKYMQPDKIALLIVIFSLQYILATLILTFIFYPIDILKQKYSLKYLSFFIFPIILIFQIPGSSKMLTNNFIINFIFEFFQRNFN
jgi:hypothetical protein